MRARPVPPAGNRDRPSPLVLSTSGAPPAISVVLPCHGDGVHLGAQLEALAAQRFGGPWELVVVDDRMEPDARRHVQRAAGQLADLTIVRSRGPGCAAARNTGIEQARSDLLAFCDDDDVVEPGWLAALHRGLEHHELVAGQLDVLGEGDAAPPPLRHRKAGFLTRGSTANLGVRRAVFDHVHPFDEDLVRSSDAEFTWRAQLAGHDLVAWPEAVVAKRSRSCARDTWRQEMSWGAAEAQLYRRYRPMGMSRSSVPGAVWAAMRHAVLSWVSRDTVDRSLHRRRLAFRIGRWHGSLRNRVLYP
jgi:glycosyltransferase involved in cell wall biosynthesis